MDPWWGSDDFEIEGLFNPVSNNFGEFGSLGNDNVGQFGQQCFPTNEQSGQPGNNANNVENEAGHFNPPNPIEEIRNIMMCDTPEEMLQSTTTWDAVKKDRFERLLAELTSIISAEPLETNNLKASEEMLQSTVDKDGCQPLAAWLEKNSSKPSGEMLQSAASNGHYCLERTQVLLGKRKDVDNSLNMNNTSESVQKAKRSRQGLNTKIVKTRKREMPSVSLASLIDNGVISMGQKVCYSKNRGNYVIKEGRATREGIQCFCCKNVYKLTSFEAHAGSHDHRPAANIFLEDGKSLIQCQMQLRSTKAVEGRQKIMASIEEDSRTQEMKVDENNPDGKSPVQAREGIDDENTFGKSNQHIQIQKNEGIDDGKSNEQIRRTCEIQQIQVGERKSNISSSEIVGVCSICGSVGSGLLPCAGGCHSVFHLSCLRLKDFPGGLWFCPSCKCGICGKGECCDDGEQFVEKTVLLCDQCNCGFHVGCLRERGQMGLESRPKGNWFCSEKCSKVFVGLQSLIGKPNPTGVDGLSWTLLRPSMNNCHDQRTLESDATDQRKLLDARDVLRECFKCRAHRVTKSDIVTDIVFNNEYSLQPHMNYRGFYTMILEKDGQRKPVCVATFRIRGEKVAEVSLMGTRLKYRRQKMCTLLLSNLEKIISSMEVESMLLPAPRMLLHKWICSFGFTPISRSDRIELLRYPFINFEDTIMCRKQLKTAMFSRRYGRHRPHYAQVDIGTS